MRGWRGTAAVLLALAGLVSGLGGARPAAASEVRDLDVYVQMASSGPAAGCWVDVTVELRSGGYALPGVEVLLGMVIGGELTYADRGMTGDSGIAYLGIDTSAGWSGADAWLDVNVNGTYIDGTSVSLTEDGPCSGDPRLWSTSKSIWLPEAGAAAQAVPEASGESASSSGSSDSSVWVPTYYQQRNLSCEFASLTIATGAFGPGVSEYEFDNLAGWSENPHWGYRGDINGSWGNTSDYGIYAAALVGPLAQVGFAGDAFYASGDSSELKQRIDWGMPTLVWLGLWGDTSFDDYTADGTRFQLTPGLHVVVAYAYDDWGVSVSDPATGSYRSYDWGTFMWMWNVMDGMALAVAPA